MKRVYVAGCYSSNDPIEMLENMRKGMRTGLELLLKGFAPFVPWFDYHFQLQLREGETLVKEDYCNYSMEWLKVCDAVLVLKGWESSKGTLDEIALAESLDIPVYYDINSIVNDKEVK